MKTYICQKLPRAHFSVVTQYEKSLFHLYWSNDNDQYSYIQGDVGHFEPMECGGHNLDDGILDHPRHLHPWQHPGALDRPGPPSDVESHQLLPRQPCHSRPWHGRVQLHTRVIFQKEPYVGGSCVTP